MFRQRLHVRLDFAPGEQAAVDARVQRLDAAIQHFREAGVVGHLGHLQAGIGQKRCGAAGGQQFDAKPGQGGGEFNDAGFVGYADQCTLYFHAPFQWEVEEFGGAVPRAPLRSCRGR